jgi:hypothetical protein
MTSTLPPHSSHSSPTLPRNHVGWAEAIVKWTRGECVDLWMYPSTTESGESLMRVYKGDFIQVSPRHRKEEWCLAQVGHVMGWLNTTDIKFLMQSTGAVIERPTQTAIAPSQSALAIEEDTKPALPPKPENPKKLMLQKLIGFFNKK